MPVTPLGVGSNTLVRDGGVEGVVVRLAGRAFAAVESLGGVRLSAGAGALDAQLAKAAAKAGIAGLEFYTGRAGRHRRRLRDERRLLWGRDQGRAGRGPRPDPRRKADRALQP